MSYSRLNMLEQRKRVFDAKNGLEFCKGWVKNVAGKGTLHVSLPPMSEEAATKICRTVAKLSERKFSLSSLVAYQMDELLKKQELNPNLYAFKRNLKQIEDTPRHYTIDTNLKSIKIQLQKTVIYELEFLFANMKEELGKHEYTVERLIELSLVDLLREIALGKAENIVQAILGSLGVSRVILKNYEDERGEELLA